jgi:hypothetical protein
MRYRITLAKSLDELYEIVIFRDFKEQEAGKDQTITMRKLFSITQAYNTVKEELRAQSAFYIKRIEEVPSD